MQESLNTIIVYKYAFTKYISSQPCIHIVERREMQHVAYTKGSLPAGGTFTWKSRTTDDGEDGNFETCYQLGNYDNYCWSKSYRNDDGDYFECYPSPVPKGPHNPNNDAWYPVDPQYINPVTNPYSCGSPCQQDMYHDGEYGDH